MQSKLKKIKKLTDDIKSSYVKMQKLEKKVKSKSSFDGDFDDYSNADGETPKTMMWVGVGVVAVLATIGVVYLIKNKK